MISTILGWVSIIGIACFILKWKQNNPGKPLITARELTEEERQCQDDMFTDPSYSSLSTNLIHDNGKHD